MSKNDLIKNLKAELYKTEKQNKVYGVGETRYDLMIKDILNYINNSIPKHIIQEKIEELKRAGVTETRNNKNEVIEKYYFLQDEIDVLEELLEGK